MALPHHVLDQADRKVLPLVALRAVELVHEVHRLLVDAPGVLPLQRLEADGAGPLHLLGSARVRRTVDFWHFTHWDLSDTTFFFYHEAHVLVGGQVL